MTSKMLLAISFVGLIILIIELSFNRSSKSSNSSSNITDTTSNTTSDTNESNTYTNQKSTIDKEKILLEIEQHQREIDKLNAILNMYNEHMYNLQLQEKEYQAKQEYACKMLPSLDLSNPNIQYNLQGLFTEFNEFKDYADLERAHIKSYILSTEADILIHKFRIDILKLDLLY